LLAHVIFVFSVHDISSFYSTFHFVFIFI